MDNRKYLRQSTFLSVTALVLLVISGFLSFAGQFPAGQELFEFISSSADYSSMMTNATPDLRIILFVDAVFILAYVSAICFAVLGFAHRNPPVAWAVGLAIIMVMFLDYWENTIMGQSMDLLAIGAQISLERIAYQSTVSAIKWQAAAATLFAISFLLPGDTIVEKLLVWGTRLGLAIAVPLFVIAPWGLREAGVLLIGISMAGGFILLALVTWHRANLAQGANLE